MVSVIVLCSSRGLVPWTVFQADPGVSTIKWYKGHLLLFCESYNSDLTVVNGESCPPAPIHSSKEGNGNQGTNFHWSSSVQPRFAPLYQQLVSLLVQYQPLLLLSSSSSW